VTKPSFRSRGWASGSEVRLLSREGRQVELLESGAAGAPVVLVHASGYSAQAWRAVAAELSVTCRVLAPHLLGYGQTGPFEPEVFALDDDVAVVSAVLDELGEPAYLVGHSYGGVLALSVARARPADLFGLALLEPVAFGVLHAAGDEAGLADLAPFERAAGLDALVGAARRGHGAAEGGWGRWLEPFVDYWHGAGAWAAMAPGQRQGIERFGSKILLEVGAVSADRTPAEAWATHELPVLVLRGERTTVASRRVSDRLAAAFPGGRLEEIVGAGHLFPMTHGAAVAQRLRAHLEAARAAQGRVRTSLKPVSFPR
jgi:pimeloyl-ACP methyl ester carboxylesterase